MLLKMFKFKWLNNYLYIRCLNLIIATQHHCIFDAIILGTTSLLFTLLFAHCPCCLHWSAPYSRGAPAIQCIGSLFCVLLCWDETQNPIGWRSQYKIDFFRCSEVAINSCSCLLLEGCMCSWRCLLCVRAFISVCESEFPWVSVAHGAHTIVEACLVVCIAITSLPLCFRLCPSLPNFSSLPSIYWTLCHNLFMTTSCIINSNLC